MLIRHLFHGRPEFEFVASLRGMRGLARHCDRLVPELIIANIKPVLTGMCPAVAAIKQTSPLSKLLVISPIDLIRDARRCGADDCLVEETLVSRLVPAAAALSISSSSRSRKIR